MVKVANGSLVPCGQQLQKGHWTSNGHEFVNDFRVFPLGSYDGILGLDWLASHSPMQVDWAAHWLSLQVQDTLVTLLGQDAVPQMFALVEVSALLATETQGTLNYLQKSNKCWTNLYLYLQLQLVFHLEESMTILFP